MHDLQTRLATVLSWLENGEDVVVKSQPKKGQPVEQKVDWSKSAAFRDRTGERVLNAEETAELYVSFKGEY